MVVSNLVSASTSGIFQSKRLTIYSLFLIAWCALAPLVCFSQNLAGAKKISTLDIDHFWIAYDSVLLSRDTATQLAIIQSVYLDQATPGLKNFIELRDHSAKKHLNNIQRYPKFWKSLRPLTLAIKNYEGEIQAAMFRFKELYPAFKQPDIYFTIGCLNSGGTTLSDQVLIGAEIGVANKTVDASELSDWLQQVFKLNQDVVYLVVHEVVHTQQKMENSSSDLLTNCLQEGSADFITEIILQKPLQSPYLLYGKSNEQMLWQKFRNEMNGTAIKDWLYNGVEAEHADLGYFMGYVICKSYYETARDKKKAIADILDLTYGNTEMTNEFLRLSKYSEKWK